MVEFLAWWNPLANHGLAVTSDGSLLVGPGAQGPMWFRVKEN